MTTLLLAEVKLYCSQAIAATAKSAATVQADGWTGVNNHHLIVFMLTANQEVRAIISDILYFPMSFRHTQSKFSMPRANTRLPKTSSS